MELPPFQTLIDEHGRDVHRFLSATVGHSAADDCYQETWLAALRAYPRLRNADNLRSWLLTIAHRKSIDYVRARNRQAVPVADVPEPADGSGSAPLIADGEASCGSWSGSFRPSSARRWRSDTCSTPRTRRSAR